MPFDLIENGRRSGPKRPITERTSQKHRLGSPEVVLLSLSPGLNESRALPIFCILGDSSRETESRDGFAPAE